MKSIQFFLLLATVLFLTSCGNDDDSCGETYDDGQVKAIIDKTCAYAGCHSGGADAGMWIPDGAKDYTTYAGLLANLNSGSFTERTLDSLNMPPPLYTPADKPQTVTAAELEILTCWMQDGYPEN